MRKPVRCAAVKGRDGSALAAVWARRRQERKGYADPEHPFRLQGSGEPELVQDVRRGILAASTKADGRLGVILPTGIYSDFGTKDFREELLHRGRIDFLYAFQNEKRCFQPPIMP